jgi:hypothetical protein
MRGRRSRPTRRRTCTASTPGAGRGPSRRGAGQGARGAAQRTNPARSAFRPASLAMYTAAGIRRYGGSPSRPVPCAAGVIRSGSGPGRPPPNRGEGPDAGGRVEESVRGECQSTDLPGKIEGRAASAKLGVRATSGDTVRLRGTPVLGQACGRGCDQARSQCLRAVVLGVEVITEDGDLELAS